jgi:hypothetical protein
MLIKIEDSLKSTNLLLEVSKVWWDGRIRLVLNLFFERIKYLPIQVYLRELFPEGFLSNLISLMKCLFFRQAHGSR